jgi:hypothetical protein
MFGALEERQSAQTALPRIVHSFSAARLRKAQRRLGFQVEHDSPLFSLESPERLSEAVSQGLCTALRYSPTDPAILVSDPRVLKHLDTVFRTSRSLGIFNLEKHSTWIEFKPSAELIDKFKEAQCLIESRAPSLFTLFNTAVSHVIPVGAVTPKKTFGFTSRQAIGLIFVDFSEKRLHTSVSQFALDLIHEATHSFVDVVLQADPLLSPECPESLFSPIRKSMRHAVGTFHGAVALASMKTLADRIRLRGKLPQRDAADLEEFENEFMEGLRTCLCESFPDAHVTKFGKILLDECRRAVL